MALAIRFDGLVRCGQVKDFAQIARLGYVTRGRLSQIMDLTNLAPDIQEELLFLELANAGKDAVTERHLRPITRHTEWASQRRLWRTLIKREEAVPPPPPCGVVATRSRVAKSL
jgi:hypothetical protein